MAPSGSRGGYLRLIPAADVTPDGLDYYLRAGAASTFEPTTAQRGDVANAVAVFMPDCRGPDARTGHPSRPRHRRPRPGADARPPGAAASPPPAGQVLTALGAAPAARPGSGARPAPARLTGPGPT